MSSSQLAGGTQAMLPGPSRGRACTMPRPDLQGQPCHLSQLWAELHMSPARPDLGTPTACLLAPPVLSSGSVLVSVL